MTWSRDLHYPRAIFATQNYQRQERRRQAKELSEDLSVGSVEVELTKQSFVAVVVLAALLIEVGREPLGVKPGMRHQVTSSVATISPSSQSTQNSTPHAQIYSARVPF